MPKDEISIDGWFERFDDTQTTVWFVEFPQAKLESQWVGNNVYPSLKLAIKAVADDIGGHFGYDVFVHEPDLDRHLTQRELVALVAEYQRQA